MTELAVAALACAFACAAPASASVRIEKTVVVRPAPHGGITPEGTLDAGQSVQEFHVRLPAAASDCDWSLTDPRTGRIPAEQVFAGQTWKLVFAALVGKRDWALIVRVTNANTHQTRETPRRWRLVLRCATVSKPPPCYLKALRVPDPRDLLAVNFHCRIASSRFRVELPAGYGVRVVFAADNSVLHEAMDCRAAGRVLTCIGRTPAYSTTWLDLVLTQPVRRALPIVVQVPHAPALRARTRTIDVRF